MRRNLDVGPQQVLSPPTPPPLVPAAVGGGIGENTGVVGSSVTLSPSKGSLNPSLLIISLILMAVLIFSVLLHLLLRYLGRSSSNTTSASSGDGNQDSVDHSHHAHRISSRRVSPEYQSLIDSLPLFSFDSVTGLKSSSTVDCAVCLSKLEPHDKLRLLPLCCHAFHAECIDTWLASSHTCPLCRSTIHVNESEEFAKLTSMSASGGGDSFRLEIGSISRRNSAAADSGALPNSRRSYSIGSFDYVVEDDSEVMVPGSNYRQGGSENNIGRKDRNGLASQDAINVSVPEPPGDQVAAEVASGGRSWLKDYVDRLASSASTSFSSRTQSFRHSGRFFTGSSRRNDLNIGSGRRSCENAVAGAGDVGSWDLEGNWVSEEMGSFFRWLSGV